MCLLGVQVRAAVLHLTLQPCYEVLLSSVQRSHSDLAQTGGIISIDQMNEIYTVQDFCNLSEVISLHQGTVGDT